MQRPQQGEGEEDARDKQAVNEHSGAKETKEAQGSGGGADKEEDFLTSGAERRTDQKETEERQRQQSCRAEGADPEARGNRPKEGGNTRQRKKEEDRDPP